MHQLRRQQYPRYSQKPYVSYGTRVFTAGRMGFRRATGARVGGTRYLVTARFDYLPHVSPRRHLGPAMALGDDEIVVINFRPTPYLINLTTQMLRDRGISFGGLSGEDYIKRELRLISRYYFREIVNYMKEYINEVVPKCTGRLRKSMVGTLNACWREVGKFPHILKINTMDGPRNHNPVFYANPVNNMPTEWLAHPHPEGRSVRLIYHRSGPRYYDLDDPLAETEWYDKVVELGSDYAQQRVGLLYTALVAMWGVNTATVLIYRNLVNNIQYG